MANSTPHRVTDEHAEGQEVVAATFDVPVECTFTNAGAMNDLPSYPVPPVTTIRGLLYAAWGRPSLLGQGSSHGRTMEKEAVDSEQSFRESFEAETAIGIRVLDDGMSKRDLRTRKKVARSSEDKQYISYPVEEETLLFPTYRIYITGDEERCSAIAGALRAPERLLYLGRSDNLVDIRDVTETQLVQHDNEQFLSDVIVPNGDGDDPVMLPVRTERIGSYSARPAEVQFVTHGGTVKTYYTLDDACVDDTSFVFIDE
jgi:CRISPR/Cas system-associated protein Cas5 (RAMP superfamily)